MADGPNLVAAAGTVEVLSLSRSRRMMAAWIESRVSSEVVDPVETGNRQSGSPGIDQMPFDNRCLVRYPSQANKGDNVHRPGVATVAHRR